jgi:hypothetical protein
LETRTWNLASKITFRFAFLYFVLYTADVPMQFVPISALQHLFRKYNALWEKLGQWVGRDVLHMQHDFTQVVVNPLGGSHDTTLIYLEALCYLLFAVMGTLLWSILDRKRANYIRLHAWLMLYLRLMLAIALIAYGSVKIFPAQFPEPSLSRLLQRYGNTSPTNLLWTFMGASRLYSFFAGAVELLGALLLLVPGLGTLGALISIGALTNVLLLNFGYDVAVKLAIINWLLMAVFIVAPDCKRLLNVFVLNRSVEAVTPTPLFRRKRLEVLAVTLPLVFGLLLVSFRLYRSQQAAAWVVANRKTAPLYGIWLVNDFKIDGKPESAAGHDPVAWRLMVIDSKTDGMIESVKGTDRLVLLHFDTDNKAFNMTMNDRSGWIANFTYNDNLPGVLVLTGTVDGHLVNATLQRQDDSKFLLKNRPFRWTQETADNH